MSAGCGTEAMVREARTPEAPPASAATAAAAGAKLVLRTWTRGDPPAASVALTMRSTKRGEAGSALRFA
ncbi:MAG: DUF1442 domain-containing protein [Sphingomonas sp.]|nr:DUF1442 domain-containing protein [Sphingomonas sp.]